MIDRRMPAVAAGRALGYSGSLIGLLWPLGLLAEIALMSVSLHVLRVVGAARLLMLGACACVLRWTVMAFDPPLPVVALVQFPPVGPL